MADLIADRFLPCGSWQLDLASGAPVRVLVSLAGTRSQQTVWSDRCAALARLRHPLLNPLVDYGAADAHHLFEAYASAPPVRASGRSAGRLLAHASRFLESWAVPLDAPRAACAMRMLVPGPASRARPVGVCLQPRHVLDVLADALSDAAPGGVIPLAIEGDTGSGLRTAWLLAARAARLAGFVPLAARTLAARPWLAAALAERHVALFVERANGGPAAEAALRLGAASTRRHLLLTFGRGAGYDARAVRVERMGGSALRAMVYIDHLEGPTMRELGQGIHAADGLPGRLVERLRGVHWHSRPAAAMVVHEATPAYVVQRTDTPPPASSGSGGRRLVRAPARAAQLVGSGRHAAAGRLLDRATRVLAARGERDDAARCAVARGWIVRDRGRNAEAERHFDAARTLAGESQTGVRAAIGLGVIRTDDDRLEQAESLLRSAHAAGLIGGSPAAADEAHLALARCLLWQGRAPEALVLLRDGPGHADEVAHLALTARVHVAGGAYTAGVEAAAHATIAARASGRPRDQAVAARAMTLARVAVGDIDGARSAAEDGLRAAAAAHAPLVAFRIRLALLGGCRSGAESTRLQAQLAATIRRGAPALLRRALAAFGPTPGPQPLTPSAPSIAGLSDLRDLLESTHAAGDDRAALQAVAGALLERLAAAAVVIAGTDTKPVVRAGRPWPGESAVVPRCVAGGAPVSSDTMPPEYAAPVRYGGETIGAVACRWSAGAAVDVERAAAACQAAALAAAASLRGLADRAPTPEADPTWENLLGTSPPAGELRRAILSAARAPFPVLVLGESGSGKELVARAIHRLGPRRHRRLCTINCAAISDDLLEAELFGHTRGAFTGATSERAGLFEEADGGTLFLDEVGELTARAQAKLLRVLQDGEVRRVGENMPRRVDTRVVAATNRCLEAEVAAGRFRADLRFRLDVIRIAVPPLRERATDIPALVAHFWEDAATRVGSRATLTPETVAALTRYDWPGNVRELQNAVASLAVHGPRRGRISPGSLPQQLARSAALAETTFEAARAEFERRYVRAALAQAGGARARAARALGVSRQGLAKMLRRLEIEAPDGPAAS